MEYKKYIRVHRKFWLKNRTFLAGEQYCVNDKITQKKWCGGCGKYKDVVYYLIEKDGMTYMVNGEYVIETDEEIDCENQVFKDGRYRNVGNEESDYDELRVNNDPNKIWSQSQNIPM